MSILTISQLERIANLVEQVIENGPPKHLRTRRLCVKLAHLDRVIAEKKSHKGETA